jgi:gamma-glutamyltranspeptidase/glutathione hydrolase
MGRRIADIDRDCSLVSEQHGRRGALLLALAVMFLVAGVPAAARGAAAGESNADRYVLDVQALISQDGTALTVTVGGEPVPPTLHKLQVKALASGGGHAETRNFFDVPAPDGVVRVGLGPLARLQPIEVKALIKPDSVEPAGATGVVLLRPDLAVRSLFAPQRVVRGHPFTVVGAVDEVAGDTAARATAVLSDGGVELASQVIDVPAGGSAQVAFPVRLDVPAAHALELEIRSAAPSESETGNNEAVRTVNVSRYAADGVVVAEDRYAAEAGAAVLRRGGNAIDAAAAVQFVLSVTEPHLSGIGGGSTVLVHLADGRDYAIDGRERAPAATTPSMYRGRSVLLVETSGGTVGVPGTIRTFEVMLDRWGTTSLAEAIEPSARLAEEGFAVGSELALETQNARVTLQPETAAIFRHADGSPLARGELLRQPDLAQTLRLIAAEGADVFYRGELAPDILAAQRRTRAAGCEGRMTLSDLANHEVVVRPPAAIDHRGYVVKSLPPSSGGGLVVLNALNIVERFPLGDVSAGWGFGSVAALHAQVEAVRLALADKQFWMGDDAFFPVPTVGLLSEGYAAERGALIAPAARIPFARPGTPGPYERVAEGEEATGHEGTQTTHFTVVDKWGNIVSATSTLADAFGTGITVPGRGFALNDSLSNFNLTPQFNPATGNPGVNDPGPNKRAMGNTAPLIVLDGPEPIMATGSLGGGFIPSVVFQVVTNYLDFKMSIEDAVAAPRFWFERPNNPIAWNAAFPAEQIAALRGLGHLFTLVPGRDVALGSAHSIAVEPGEWTLHGAADPRRVDSVAIVLPPG